MSANNGLDGEENNQFTGEITDALPNQDYNTSLSESRDQRSQSFGNEDNIQNDMSATVFFVSSPERRVQPRGQCCISSSSPIPSSPAAHNDAAEQHESQDPLVPSSPPVPPYPAERRLEPVINSTIIDGYEDARHEIDNLCNYIEDHISDSDTSDDEGEPNTQLEWTTARPKASSHPNSFEEVFMMMHDPNDPLDPTGSVRTIPIFHFRDIKDTISLQDLSTVAWADIVFEYRISRNAQSDIRLFDRSRLQTNAPNILAPGEIQKLGQTLEELTCLRGVKYGRCVGNCRVFDPNDQKTTDCIDCGALRYKVRESSQLKVYF